jgi:hypothetical protein
LPTNALAPQLHRGQLGPTLRFLISDRSVRNPALIVSARHRLISNAGGPAGIGYLL